MTYKLGLVDAPWKYDNMQQNDPKRGGITYPTLTMKELYDIPIGNAFDKDSILFSWVTLPKLMDSFYETYNPLTILKNWGFRPVTAAFVWVKLNKNDTIQNDDIWRDFIPMNAFYSGLGRYTNSNVEICIVARKGKGLPRVEKNVKQLIFAPIGSHSAKPKEQYDRISRLYGDVSRVELFARDINPPPLGWDATGLDYDGIDIREWIKQYEVIT